MNSAKLPQGAMNDAINAVYPLIPTDGSSVGQRLEIAKAIVEAVLQATQQSEGSDTIHALKCEVAALKKRNGELYRELNALRDVGIVLSAEGSKRLIELLENPPAPNEALKELFRKHGASVVSRGVSRRIPCGCVTGGEPCSHFSNSGTQQSFGDAPTDVLDDAARNLPAESLQPGAAAGAQPAASMNHLQRRTLMRLMETLRGADEVDVQVRKDGQTHHFEIDWLRDALAASFGGETQQALRPITDEAVKRAVEASNAATEQHIKDGNVSVPATVWMRAAIEAALSAPQCRCIQVEHDPNVTHPIGGCKCERCVGA